MKLKKPIARAALAGLLAVATAVSSMSSVIASATPQLTDDYAQMLVQADSSVNFSASAGVEEYAYAEWAPVANATGYNAYVDGTQVDSMLIRQYASYMRVDVPGLKAGSHTIKVVPIISGSEDSSKAGSTTVTVVAHDRTGFAFSGTDGSCGAYNADGTLKTNAVVVYVTEDTKDTVSMDVITSNKGATTTCTGIQAILDGYKKGYDTRPLDIRVIGKVTDPSYLTSGDLLISGSGDTKRLSNGLTIEGIGEDATLYGFGLRIKNTSDMEIRNLAIMLVDSDEGDNYSVQQSCDHIWIHHCDSFYGEAGSDSDQAKGDGAMDCKKSTYLTFSYNHFYDNGKCCLLGLSEGTTEDLYITYHHNWFDHSDSRHPRVRYYSAHVYNNYYDGNAKYGMGACLGCSIFSESNYFEDCKYPMMISMQGSDVVSDWTSLTRDVANMATFSKEDGGMIKAYGNIMSGQKSFVSYQENSTEFDAYVVTNKTDQVPSSVTSYAGGNTYNNFDTSSVMYSYTADNAADVPAIVTANAGRLNGGDFTWEFSDADAENYSVNTELMAALRSYDDSILAIGSGFTTNSTPATTTTAPATTTAATTSATAATTASTSATTVSKASVATTTVAPTDGDIFCSPNGTGSGKTESDPTTVEKAITSITAGHTIWLLEGTYSFSAPIVIEDTNNGTASAYKGLKSYNGADVTFDFSGETVDGSNRGIVLDGDYWYLYGFEITKAGDNGLLLSGNNNVLDMLEFVNNQDTGMQISRYKTANATIDTWPANNLIKNCTAHDNCDDATMENADGFAAKLTCGEGNVFDGCMSYNNSDDGWDLFAKTETGPTGVVTIQNSIAFRNGYTSDGRGYGDCDGNGFKLGGSGVGSAHVVKNCLAFENLNCGFTDNNNPKLGSLTDCTAFNNGIGQNGKPNFSCYRCTDGDGCDFDNLLCYYDSSVLLSDSQLALKIANDKFNGTIANSVYYNSGYYQVSSDTAVTNGEKVGTKLSAGPSSSDFISMAKAPAVGTDFHTAWRNADGSINNGGLYETVSGSTYYSMGYHMYNGSAVITTTATSATTKTTTTTTTTVATAASTSSADSSTAPMATTGTTTGSVTAGSYEHNFTLNGTDSTFYNIEGNLSTAKGTVTYNGMTLTQCLKIESSTLISFNAPTEGKLTLVFNSSSSDIEVDGETYDLDSSYTLTITLDAGTHTIDKASSGALYYMLFEPSATETTTSATTAAVTTSATSATTAATTTATVATTVSADSSTAPISTTEAATTASATTASDAETTTTTTAATTKASESTTSSEEVVGTILFGDLNMDGLVDMTDVVIMNKIVSGTISAPTTQQVKNGDLDQSGSLDAADAKYLLQFNVHMITALPVEG